MSLGSILSTAAPIAAGYFTGGAGGTSLFGLEATGSAIAAGALTGAGIAALSGGDILGSGVMGGLGGFGGAQMATAFNPAVEGLGKSGLTSAEFNAITQDPNVISGAIDSGVSAGVDISSAFPSTAAPGSYNLAGTSLSPTTAGAGVQLNSAAMPTVGTEGISSNFYAGINPTESVSRYTNIAESAIPNPVDTSFSAGVERLGDGSMSKGAMKLGLAGLPVLAAAYEPETFTYDQMKEAEAYDPDATLNLLDPELDSGIEDVINEDSGLRLYAKEGGMIPTYAEGGTIESRAKEGMAGALARNQGTSYAQPTTIPTTAPSNNIKIAGAGNSTSNIGRGVGSLNVGSGTIGLSPDAARLKAIEDAKPKTRTMQGPYGMSMTVPIDYDPGVKSVFGGRKPSHYQLKDGTYVKGTPPSINMIGGDRTNAYGYVNRFAEGGTIETRADQGMRDALARNQGTAYTQPTTTASNVNTQPALNINRGMGSLNVNSGSIGQSANAIAEAARLKTIEDAKPKAFSGQNVGGAGGQGSFNVPSELVMGGGYRPTGAIMAGPAANYYRDIAGNYIRRAEGGPIPAAYAEGGMLEGPGDGMSDSLAAQIDGSQPAALSQGEFVVPADVVSHLGNGSSDAGSKRLYAMMDEVRNARTGTKKQGKEINPERYMPA